MGLILSAFPCPSFVERMGYSSQGVQSSQQNGKQKAGALRVD